jgi:hypothetical protein
MTEEEILHARQKSFIDALRKEASDAKSCVTQYSFQSLAISGAALGFIFNNSKDNNLAPFASMPIIIILMIMARIAIYKYEIANRAYGYEFYLKKITSLFYSNENIFNEEIDPWKFMISNEHWESAFFAWRIVSPTLFRSFYKVDDPENWLSLLKPFAYSAKHPGKETWILVGNRESSRIKTRKNSRDKVVYFPGSYLSNILTMLMIMQILLIVPLVYAIKSLYYDKLIILLPTEEDKKYSVPHIIELMQRKNWDLQNVRYFLENLLISRASIVLAVTLVLIYFVWVRWQRIERRREIIESELHSIRTCSIIWGIIARIHFASWTSAKDEITGTAKLSNSIDFLMTNIYENNLYYCAGYISENCLEPGEWNFVEYLKSKN